MVLGVGHQSLTTSLEWIQIVGSGYVHLLQMLVMPLVFVSIVGAFVRIKESNKIGKISANVLFVLLSTTAIAATIGSLIVLAFHLDGLLLQKVPAETARIAQLAERQTQVKTFLSPTNYFVSSLQIFLQI